MANVQRDLDVVVWGATGFTGALATAYLAGDKSSFHSFTLAGAAAPRNLKWYAKRVVTIFATSHSSNNTNFILLYFSPRWSCNYHTSTDFNINYILHIQCEIIQLRSKLHLLFSTAELI